MSVLILDVSNVQGTVDWKRVKQAGIKAVWMKASEGVTFDDPRWMQWRKEANALGIRVGAYHFARPDRGNSPEAEADHFCKCIGKVGRTDLRPVLDLEVNTSMIPSRVEAWARRFNQRVKSNLGVLPAFYSYPAYIKGLKLRKTIGNGLWLASYSRNDGKEHPFVIPAPWRRVIAHQFTSKGSVAGVKGNVDLSTAPHFPLAYPIRGRVLLKGRGGSYLRMV